jgi:hemin uptake protein HemP
VSKNPLKPADSAPETVVQPNPLRAIDSRDLMQGEREVAIRHGDEWYRLTVTRAGKLILHK